MSSQTQDNATPPAPVDSGTGITGREQNNNTGGNNNNNNNDRRNNNRENNRRNEMSANERDWEGDKPDIGAVIGLRVEWLDKKTSFRNFMEKMVDYVLREFDNANDILPLVRDQIDPFTDFETNNMPTDLTDDEKQSDVKVAIQQQRIKMYVTREMKLQNNIFKIYGLIKGQCSHTLKAVLKQETDYESKDRNQDVIWLMGKLKSLTSGLDSKSNKRNNLFEALIDFIAMKQGDRESDTAYMKRFKVNLDTLLSAGGKHILCSPELADCTDPKNMSEAEVDAEEAKFKAIVFLKRSDPHRYNELNMELQNSAHLGRDEYPTSETDAMDLMVR